MEERAEMYYNNNVVKAHLFPPCLFEAPSIIITLSPVATVNLVSKVPLWYGYVQRGVEIKGVIRVFQESRIKFSSKLIEMF